MGSTRRIDQFSKDCVPWEGPHSTGDESDREGAAEKKRYRLALTPIPLFPCATRGEEVEEGEWGRGAFGFFPLFLTSLAC